MRFQASCAAAALLAASCAAAGGAPGAPPSARAIEARITVERGGAVFAQAERRIWRRRAERFELPGPDAAEGDGLVLECTLTGDYNLGGEFWGELELAEFERGAGGARIPSGARPARRRLGTTTARHWLVDLPGRDGAYRVRVAMDYDFWVRAERARAR